MAKTKNKKTLIAFLVDRSGSMQSIKEDTEGGLKSFLEEQKETQEKGETISVTLAQFDTDYETVYENVLIEDVPDYKLQPRGATALIDSLYRLISTIDETVSKMAKKDRPDSVIIVTLTDGAENSSREITADKVKELVQKKTDDGWSFMFLGANIDAVTTGSAYGFSADLSITYAASAAGVKNTFGSVSRVAKGMRAGASAADTTFSAEEREEAVSD